MRKSRKKNSIVRNLILAILAVLIITAGIYLCFGGFTTGKCADTAELEKIWNKGVSDNKYTSEQKADIINKVKAELPDNKNLATVQAAHFADILLQNIELSETMDDTQTGLALRDKLMSENVMWILEPEKARGNSRIFISGHNGHVNQFGSYADMISAGLIFRKFRKRQLFIANAPDTVIWETLEKIRLPY